MKFTICVGLCLSLAVHALQEPFLRDAEAVTTSPESVNLRLVQTGDDIEPRWILEEDKLALRRAGIKFFDITDHQDLGQSNFHSVSLDESHSAPEGSKEGQKGKKGRKDFKGRNPFPKKLRHDREVNSYLRNITQGNMRTNLEIFTNFHSRYYKSQYGAASGQFLFDLVSNTTSVHSNLTVSQFKHPWGQHTVIASIPGTDTNLTVVIGAHQDSANMFLPNILRSPGADDDGSGTVTILEVLRVLSVRDFRPRNTVEFHWYSAEEGGLLGSQAVFANYEKRNVSVIAMLQQDMTGYVKKTLDAHKPEALGVITDFVDRDLTEFIKTVISGYCSIPYSETKCGYACSDHASASKAGYRSAFVIESEFKLSNPFIHSDHDVIQNLSFDHMEEHAKLTLGFAIELGRL